MLAGGEANSVAESQASPNHLTRLRSHSLVLAAVSFAVYFLYRVHHAGGDELIYADNILRGRFGDISIHFGYYVLGFVFHKIAGLFGLPIDVSLVLMSNLFGAAGAVMAYLLLERLAGDSEMAFLGSLIFAFSGVTLFYSSSAEVYLPQTFCVLASMYLFITRRSILSGLLFGLAALITPLSFFVFPFYIFFFVKDRMGFKEFLKFAAAFAVVYVPIFAAVYNDLLWGRRGLLKVGTGRPVQGPLRVLFLLGSVAIKSLNVMVFFGLVGAVYLFFRKRLVFVLIVIMFLSQLYQVVRSSSTSEIETFLLQAWPFFSLVAAAGLLYLTKGIFRNRAAAGALNYIVLLPFVVINLLFWIGPDRMVNPRIMPDKSYQESLKLLEGRMGANSTLLAGFWDGVSYAYYTRVDPREELETTMGNTRWVNVEYLKAAELEALRADGVQIYVMDSYSSSIGASLLLSKQELEARSRSSSIRSQVERMAGGEELLDFFQTPDFRVYRLAMTGSDVGGSAVRR